MPVRFSRAALMTTGALFSAALVWGLVPVATRYLLNTFAPLQLMAVRFLIATICFLPMLVSLRKQRWTIKLAGRALLCGLIGVIGYYVVVAYGQQLISAGMTGLLLASQPIWILLISALFLREKLRASSPIRMPEPDYHTNLSGGYAQSSPGWRAPVPPY